MTKTHSHFSCREPESL